MFLVNCLLTAGSAAQSSIETDTIVAKQWPTEADQQRRLRFYDLVVLHGTTYLLLTDVTGARLTDHSYGNSRRHYGTFS